MTDYSWPDDLVPYGSGFKLDPHTGGSESPFSRTSKIYGLSAPRWTCSLHFRTLRGSRWGTEGDEAARLDAIIASLKGRQNRVALYDFDYALPRAGLAMATGNLAASAGATSITLTGMPPGALVYSGDYFGGDGRPHIIRSDTFDAVAATADSSGQASVIFEPPLSANIGANAAVFTKVTAMFRLTDDGAGDNYNETGQQGSIVLQFVEDL